MLARIFSEMTNPAEALRIDVDLKCSPGSAARVRQKSLRDDRRLKRQATELGGIRLALAPVDLRYHQSSSVDLTNVKDQRARPPLCWRANRTRRALGRVSFLAPNGTYRATAGRSTEL
jgi:hypothetical protein